MFSLMDRVVIVTGAGRGIGRGIALGLARAGAHVALAEIDAATGESMAAEVRALGRKALVVPTDVRKSDQVADLVERTVKELGRLDIQVNNVGGMSPAQMKRVLDMDEATWDHVINLNLKSTFLCCQAAARAMKEQGKGAIINIGSLVGLTTSQLPTAHYAAAKAAVIHFTRYLALEWTPYHIRVNCIAPGTTETPAGKAAWSQRPQELLAERLRAIPMHRMAQPEDYAGAAVFLASDASGYMTGQTLLISGGP